VQVVLGGVLTEDQKHEASQLAVDAPVDAQLFGSAQKTSAASLVNTSEGVYHGVAYRDANTTALTACGLTS
jgi:hypothetical protein